MKQIILTLAVVATSVTAVFGQGTGVLDRYYIDGLIYEKTSGTTVSCEGAFDDGVKKVVIPEAINADGTVFTVIGISDRAFYQNYSLSSITIPKTIESISEDAFATGSSNISVYISDLTAWCKIDFENESANPLRNVDSKLYVNGVLVTDLKIPDGITEIKPYSFYGLDSMTSLTLPNSVTTIGYFAFVDCSSLTSLTIPSSVTTIERAFSGCDNLKAIYISDLSAWCKIDFNNTYYITVHGANPLYYAHNLYLNGELLTNLVIPNGITEIKERAFRGGTCFETLTLPNTITKIMNSAFMECSGLVAIRIPDSVIELGEYVFGFCEKLETVIIGRNVSAIDYGAFYYSPNIRKVDVLALNPPEYPEVIDGEDYTGIVSTEVYEKAVLSVPTGSLEAYRSADGWKNFKNIQEKDFGGVYGIENDAVSVTAKGGSIEIGGAANTRVEVYNLAGQLVYSGTETTVGGLARGIYIVRVNGQAFKVAL